MIIGYLLGITSQSASFQHFIDSMMVELKNDSPIGYAIAMAGATVALLAAKSVFANGDSR